MMRFGHISKENTLIDEVLVVSFPGKAYYTGENSAEIF
jgi:tRNA U34 5-carboxymethylaminomethyl modifying GTPase MnmE/TrmE